MRLLCRDRRGKFQSSQHRNCRFLQYHRLVDAITCRLLDGIERRIEERAEAASVTIAADAKAFGPIRDPALPEELRVLARHFWVTFIATVRAGQPPTADQLRPFRDRAAQRAREMVPLPALVRAYVTGMRRMLATMLEESRKLDHSEAAVIGLISQLADFHVVTMTAMVEAFDETVQGERAERNAEHLELLDELIGQGPALTGELARKVAALNVLGEREQVVALANITPPPSGDPANLSQRWAIEHIVRATGRAPSRVLAVMRGQDLVTVLDHGGDTSARVILQATRKTLLVRHGAALTAGIGTPFTDARGVSQSYAAARRALRHTSPARPILTDPQDISLFDDLALSAGGAADELIPAQTLTALQDPALRQTLTAFVAANLSVAGTAHKLILHENSVRYRLRKIAQLTGRDPRNITDLLELIAASRLITTAQHDGSPDPR
jgi:sugar diacid utilization regulator